MVMKFCVDEHTIIWPCVDNAIPAEKVKLLLIRKECFDIDKDTATKISCSSIESLLDYIDSDLHRHLPLNLIA